MTTAIALGACLVEKHLTLDRAEGGPDAAFSLQPDELADTVQAIREIEAALGTVRYGPSPSEQASLAFRRSVWVTRDLEAGEAFSPENLAALRPAGGLAPDELEQVLGRRASRAIAAGTALAWDLVD